MKKETTTVFNKAENFEIENLDKRMYKYIFNSELFISAYQSGL